MCRIRFFFAFGHAALIHFECMCIFNDLYVERIDFVTHSLVFLDLMSWNNGNACDSMDIGAFAYGNFPLQLYLALDFLESHQVFSEIFGH